MTNENVLRFCKTMDEINNPRKRRAFIDSFYAKLRHACSLPRSNAIAPIVELLGKYGFHHHARKFLGLYFGKDGKAIDSIADNHESPVTQTIGIGLRILNSGPGWSISEPELHIRVEGKRFEVGQVLHGIPDGAVVV